MSHRAGRSPATAAARGGTLLIAALVLAAGGCRRGTATQDTAASAVVVGAENVAVARVATLQSGPVISGTLQPELDATLRAQLTGPVLQTYADQGQRVGKGQLLMRIDDSAIRDQYLSAHSAVTSAETAHDVAARNLERAQTLLKAGAIAPRDVEQAQQAEQAARSQLADARARLAQAQQALGNTQIRAPFDGVVSQRAASAGDVVQPGTPLITVVNPSSMRLEAAVPSDQLTSVRLAAPVTFTVNGYPGRVFTGHVTRINPVADPVTRQVSIVVSIPNEGNRLVGGLYAQGRIATQSKTALAAPVSAIDTRYAGTSVLRVKGGKVERVPVTVGMRDDQAQLIELASGVAAGDTLLLGAAQAITPGTPVRIVAPGDTAVAVR